MFSVVESIKVPPTEFKGGRISNVFGGMELDLTQTTLAPGTSILEINSVFGGAVIIVPTDWVVTIQVNSMMGGFNDKRTIIKNRRAVLPTENLSLKALMFLVAVRLRVTDNRE